MEGAGFSSDVVVWGQAVALTSSPADSGAEAGARVLERDDHTDHGQDEAASQGERRRQDRPPLRLRDAAGEMPNADKM